MSDETPTNDAAPSPAAETPPTPETPAAPTPASEAAPAPAPEAPAATTPPAAPPAAATAATQPEMPAATTPPAQPAAAPAAEPVAAAPASTSHVAVPKWVLVTVAAVVGAGVMFGIGYAVGDGSNSNDSPASVGTPFNPNGGGSQPTPGFPGQGNGNQNGGGSQPTPQSPNQSASDAFLGVATQQTNDGLEIVQVVSGSAADDAGLEVGDVIVGFDGNDVTTPAQLANAVGNLDPGDEVEIEYQRDGNTRTTTVELGTRSTTNSN